MPNIAIFPNLLTREEEIRDKLAELTGYRVMTDEDLLEETARRFTLDPHKLEKALYHKTSVFNKFTLERERCIASLKSILADHLTHPQKLYHGFITTLIPSQVSNVLKVLMVESRETRIKNNMASGLSKRAAEKLIKQGDQSALNWTDFIHGHDPWDKRLHDIILPIDDMPSNEVVKYISEQSAQGTLLDTEDSKQAIIDMTLATRVELVLLDKGYKPDIDVSPSKITLRVHESVINFDLLKKELIHLVTPLASHREIRVKMARDYADSIYRDQEFTLPPKVLLVDDERDFVLTLSERLMSRNVGSYAVYDGQEALSFLENDKPDVMVLDLKMPGVDGLEVLRQTKRENPDIEIIILTGHGTEEDKKNCLELGAFAYLQKPTDIQTLSAKIHEAHTRMLTTDQE